MYEQLDKKNEKGGGVVMSHGGEGFVHDIFLFHVMNISMILRSLRFLQQDWES